MSGKLPPILDRELFFADPLISGSQISPDGKYISFIKPINGILNIFVKKFDQDFNKAWSITEETERPIGGYFWTWDSKQIIYSKDIGGDENYHLLTVDPFKKSKVKDLTLYTNTKAIVFSLPKRKPNKIVIGLNNRVPQLFDVYELDLTTYERKLLYTNNEGVVDWVLDLDGNLRLALRETMGGGSELLNFNSGKFKKIYECSGEESFGVIRFHKDGERVYLVTNKGRDKDLSELHLLDTKTGELEFIEKDPEGEVDFNGADFSLVTDELISTYYLGDKLRFYPKENRIQKDWEIITKNFKNVEIYLKDRTLDEEIFLLIVSKDTDPGSVYSYVRDTGEIKLQYQTRPDLPSKYLSKMESIRYKARDGMEIGGYLTIPKGFGKKNLPLIVNPHGGPWDRDVWGYDSYVQFFANRGYAVFQPNFRGSVGFGKKYLNAGNKEWGTGYMQHDITDGVQYLLGEGIVDEDRIGIFGGSYGGYATLAGLAFTPDLYKAGVSFVGPSSIITLIKTIPPYWEPLLEQFKLRVGDIEDPKELEDLEKKSPLYSVDKIKGALMIVQGANDPRVKKAESDQIVEKMKELGRPVEYLVAENEGHGFAHPENRLAMIVAMEKFFAEHIGGRYQEEVGEEIEEVLSRMRVAIDR